MKRQGVFSSLTIFKRSRKMKKTNTTNTTNENVIKEQELVFNTLKNRFNNLQSSNKDILINAVLMYRLGYNKDSLFERVKNEYKGTDNWTAIRVNATRNFTGAVGLLKYAKEKGVDMSTWKDSFIVDSFIKAESLTINNLYKKGQEAKKGQELKESPLNRFNNALISLFEKYDSLVSTNDILDSLNGYLEYYNKKQLKESKKQAKKVA